MKEVFLDSVISLDDYKAAAEGSSVNKPVMETRNGREYVKWSYEKNVMGIARAIRIVKAIALTVFTLFLGLLFNDVRLLWAEGISGKEVVLVFNPLSKTRNMRERRLEAPLRRAATGASSSAAMDNNLDRSGSVYERIDYSLADRGDEFSDSVDLSNCEEGEQSGEEGESLFNASLLLSSGSEENQTESAPEEILKAKRKEINHALRNALPFPADESITSFLDSCLDLYGDRPHWSGFKNFWLAYRQEAGQRSDRALPNVQLTHYFYEAISLIKDFKVATTVERVRTKILLPIELDRSMRRESIYAQVPTHPGPVDKRIVLVGGIRADIYSAQGVRGEMENQDLARLLQIDRLEGRLSVPCFAVFDGHCGWECSAFLKNRFAEFITEELKAIATLDDLNITNALKMAFVKVNREFSKDSRLNGGSTAIVALVINGSLWVANTGSSRAVLSDGGVARQLSEDADPGKEKFLKGILSRGGWVFNNRLNGRLATARAFGDKGETGLTARPKIHKVDISSVKEKPRHLILACDGLFDVVNSYQAVRFIEGYNSPADAAEYLFNLAFHRGTRDNVTVMVARLS